jgi:hypothetical protein
MDCAGDDPCAIVSFPLSFFFLFYYHYSYFLASCSSLFIIFIIIIIIIIHQSAIINFLSMGFPLLRHVSAKDLIIVFIFIL